MKTQSFICSLVLLITCAYVPCNAFISNEDAMRIAKANYQYQFHRLAHETILSLATSVRSARNLLNTSTNTNYKNKIEAAKGVFLINTVEFYEMSCACLNFGSGLAPFFTSKQAQRSKESAKADLEMLVNSSDKMSLDLFVNNLMTQLVTLSPEFDYSLNPGRYKQIKNTMISVLLNKNKDRHPVKIKLIGQFYYF